MNQKPFLLSPLCKLVESTYQLNHHLSSRLFHLQRHRQFYSHLQPTTASTTTSTNSYACRCRSEMKEEEEEGAEKNWRSREKKKKAKKVFRPDYIYRPKQAEILAEVELGGASYRFACRYEIFRPFRPEWNGIYNIDPNTNAKIPSRVIPS